MATGSGFRSLDRDFSEEKPKDPHTQRVFEDAEERGAYVIGGDVPEDD